MKKLFHLFSITLLVVILTACGEKMGMKEYTSVDGRYSIFFPGRPVVKNHKVKTAIGFVNMKVAMVDRKSVAYMAAYVDYPKNLLNRASSDQILNSAKNGAMKNVDGNIIEERKVFLEGKPGVELHFDAKNGKGRGHAVIILADNRLYQVLTIGSKGKFKEETSNEMMRSFKIW